MVHESDVETDARHEAAAKIRNIIGGYDRELKIFQNCIREFDMVRTTDTNGNPVYNLPDNPAGNEMDADYRLQIKTELIVNMDKLLAELNGFLPQEAEAQDDAEEYNPVSEQETGSPK